MPGRPRPPPTCSPATLVRTIQSEPHDVRACLMAISAGLTDVGTDTEVCATAELIMAEVLNNVVEHAYVGTRGPIDITVRPGADGLYCQVRDFGRPMPGGVLPQGRRPDTAARDLPEGGFGWFLIRELARDLRYQRRGGSNVLSFRVPALPAGDQ